MSETLETKFTDGPWDWHESENTLIGRAGIVIIKDGGAYEGLHINDFDRLTPEVAEANKRLLAGAPDLYEALCVLLAATEPAGEEDNILAGAKSIARKAISRVITQEETTTNA